MKIYLIAVILFSHCTFAFSAYISEDSSVHFRTGPSIKYRVAGVIKSGEPVTVIDSRSNKSFHKIKTSKGVLGWVSSKQIKSGKSKLETIALLESSVSNSVILIKKQADEIHRLKNLLNQQKTENLTQSNKQVQLTSKINTLSSQIDKLDDSNLIRWLTHTGVITIFAIAMILLITIVRKRRSYNEIY
jgi:SH3 domain protein